MVEVQQSSPRMRRIGCSVFAGAIAFLVVLFVVAGTMGGNGDEEPAAGAGTTTTQAAGSGQADQWADIDEWLRMGYFMLSSWDEWELPDGEVSWQSHVDHLAVDGDRALVHLELTSDTPGAGSIGEEAASFVAAQIRVQQPAVAEGVRAVEAISADGVTLDRQYPF